MTSRALPRSFDAIVVFIVAQSHLAALFVALSYLGYYRSPTLSLALLGCSFAIPLGCVATARRRGGEDLPLPAFAAAGAALLAVDVALAATMQPGRIGTPAMWSAVAVGVTLLALCPYRPPRDLIVLAGAHATVIAVVLFQHRGQPSVEPFAVIVQLSAALVPAVAAAEFVRFYVRSLRRRQDAVAEQARAQARVAAAAAIQEDADRRLARLRKEVLPLLADVASGRRPVDDLEGAALAARLSGELRQELVEARSGAWLLAAPVAALTARAGGPRGGGHGPGDRVGDLDPGRDVHGDLDDRWPGIVLLDPQRLVGRLDSRDLAAMSAVLAALRAVGGWKRVAVAFSLTYPVIDPDDGAAQGSRPDGEAAFVTVVSVAVGTVDAVDPAVAAAADRAGCAVSLEQASTCVVEGRLPLQPSARLER